MCPSVRRLLYCGRESDIAVFVGDVTSEYRLSQVSLKETPLAGALCGLMLLLDAMMIKLDRECPETIGGSVTVNQHRPEREKRGELCTVTGGKIYRCKVNRENIV